MTIEWKDGDYFRWSYKQPYINKHQASVRAGALYWCCSRIGVVVNGVLKDTFWSGVSGCTTFTKEIADEILDLEFLANKDDMEETVCPQYYNPEDVIDIRHSNMSRGGLYIKKGSTRSPEKIKDLINAKISDEKRKIESATREINWLNEKMYELARTNDEDLEKFYI